MSKINNLSFCLRKLEKKEQCNSEPSRRKEIIKIEREINELDSKK